MNKKKIIIVYQYFGTRKSKWSSRWYDFALELKKNNYEVTVLTSNFIRSDLSMNKKEKDDSQKSIEKYLCKGLNINFVRVHKIERTPAGKFKHFFSDLDYE